MDSSTTGSYVPPSSPDVDLLGGGSGGSGGGSGSTDAGLDPSQQGGATAVLAAASSAAQQLQRPNHHVRWTPTTGAVRVDSAASDGANSLTMAAAAAGGGCGQGNCLPAVMPGCDGDRDGDGDDHMSAATHRSNASKSSLFSHLTDATDYEAMERNYRKSSICTEAIEQRGLKDPLGFAVICSTVLVGGMSRGIIYPTLWLFVESLGGSTITMGYCIAAFSFGRVVTSPILGHLSVSMGYRVTLNAAGGFVCLGSLLYVLAQAVGRAEFLILAQCVLGIGTGTLAVTRAYVAEVTPRGLRTRYLAYLAAVRHAGFTITPFLGAALVWYFQDESHIINPDGIFIVDMYTAPAYFLLFFSTVTLFATAFLLTHTRREVMPKITRKVSSRVKADLAADVPLAISMGQEKTPFCGMTVINCVVAFIVVLNMVSKGYTVTYETLGVKLAQETFNIESTTVGVTMGCAGVLGICILLSFKSISRYVDDIHKIAGGFIVSIFGIASLTDFGGGGDMGLARFVLGFFFVYGIGWPISDTAIVGLYSKVSGNKPQGTLQGLLAVSSALSRMLVPLLASYVSHYSSMSVFFIAINVIIVFSAAFVIYYRQLLITLST